MLCQIIDDVLDYSQDALAELPSFLTAAASLPQGLAWTAEAVRSYAALPAPTQSPALFPLRVALWVVSKIAAFTIRTAARQFPYSSPKMCLPTIFQRCESPPQGPTPITGSNRAS
jgi:hypothetical protein